MSGVLDGRPVRQLFRELREKGFRSFVIDELELQLASRDSRLGAICARLRFFLEAVDKPARGRREGCHEHKDDDRSLHAASPQSVGSAVHVFPPAKPHDAAPPIRPTERTRPIRILDDCFAVTQIK